jgi:hypothetical protein
MQKIRIFFMARFCLTAIAKIQRKPGESKESASIIVDKPNRGCYPTANISNALQV